MLSIRKLPIIPGIILIAFFAAIPFVKAQNQESQGGGNGLQISPTRTEVNAQPGEAKTFSITLRNVTQGELVAQASVKDFESDNESGAPQIIVDENQRTPYTINNYLKGLSDVELKPNEVKEVKLTLEVPADAVPGAYFGAVTYDALPKQQQDRDRQVSLTASVAHLVLLEVAGDINEQIQLESLKAQRDGNSSSFFINAPDSMAVAVKNLGNGFSRPFGNVQVKNIFGKEVANYEVNNTTPKGVVLPQSSRTFIDPVDNFKLPGRYTASAAIAYGNGGEVVVIKSSFWYMPVWLIVVLIALIAVGVFYGRRYYISRFGSSTKKRRKKNK